jgi:hypothetical protein
MHLLLLLLNGIHDAFVDMPTAGGTAKGKADKEAQAQVHWQVPSRP